MTYPGMQTSISISARMAIAFILFSRNSSTFSNSWTSHSLISVATCSLRLLPSPCQLRALLSLLGSPYLYVVFHRSPVYPLDRRRVERTVGTSYFSHNLAQSSLVRCMYVFVFLFHYLERAIFPLLFHLLQAFLNFGELLGTQYSSILVRSCPRN